MPLVAGGLADQPMGYLADVMQVRQYLRACEAVELEQQHGLDENGTSRMPASLAATFLHLAVGDAVQAQLAAEQEHD